MAQPDLSILFADISGSTSLYERLGDTIARELIARCLATITQVIQRNNGTVIKTIGDEIMCTFPSADDATQAATEMQDDVSDGIEVEGEEYPLQIRVGLHHGPVIREKGDVFGDAVNVAARMAALAKGGQIITSKATVDALNPALRASTRLLDKLPVKGKREMLEIYEVVWQEEDVTHIATGLFATVTGRDVKLTLTIGDNQVVLDQGSPPTSLGRGKRADIVVEDSFASREHVRIEVRRGKFVLLDTSTNGTYVETEDGNFYLRREEAVLRGSGRIALGRDFNENPEQVVLFEAQE